MAYAAHEAGHAVMCEFFGVEPFPDAVLGPDGEFDGGVVRAKLSSLSVFQKSAVGWGGILGETLRGLLVLPRPDIPLLTAYSLPRWVHFYWCKFPSGVSDSDRGLMALGNSTASARFSFETLSCPAGAGRLWLKTQELYRAFRLRHGTEAGALGRVAAPEVRDAAQRMIHGDNLDRELVSP
jgi:hypothetical protein